MIFFFFLIKKAFNRSVVAKHWCKSLEGGWREDSLWRATRIRKFPVNAVMERRMSTAKKHEKFGVKGRLLVKGNKDERITKKTLWRRGERGLLKKELVLIDAHLPKGHGRSLANTKTSAPSLFDDIVRKLSFVSFWETE